MPGVGIRKFRNIGDYVKVGDKLAEVYYEDIKASAKVIENSFMLSSKKQERLPLIYVVIK